MALDRTQHQSTDEIKKARELSLEPTRPPAQVPGYKLQKFLGSGAFGEVWLAVDIKTSRRVAIKFYTRRSAADVQQLAREVEKLVVLAADRYVVQLLDVGWESDPPFYVMDYIEHGSLEDRLNAPEGMSTDDAIELFKEIATGMLHLHDKGVLHCDLKPGNVLLDQDGKPRVADFGQSRLQTEATSALGTLFYMAPEQADLNAAPDAGWDVYGLGALLYSMLTGKPPYYSTQLANQIESTEDVHQRLVVYRDSLLAAPKPMEHRSIAGVDRSMAEIIDRCIAADSKERFPNIQSLLVALHQRELTKAGRPLMLLGLVGPLLLIGVMSFFGWWAFREAVDRTQVEVTNKAVESNEFAAQLAARSAAEQIDEYFRVVGQLSRDKEFKAVFGAVVDAENSQLLKWRTAIADPAKNAKGNEEVDAEIGESRRQFRKNELRKELQPFLEERLRNNSGDYPVAASWFVSDRFGNQIASAFRKENKTLGNNYSYRTYFTGLDYDLKTINDDGAVSFDVAKDPASRKIIQDPNLSAVFISEQSNSWKVAFSAPIYIDEKVEGIVAVTVELGSFIDFTNTQTHYAMLVESSVDQESGVKRGIILEHPLFQFFIDETGKIPDELVQCRLDLASLKPEDQFQDPVGQTKAGAAQNYNRQSIVAQAEVTMKSQAGSKNKTMEADRKGTGLIVLAVEDQASIVAPANDLARQLGQLASLAALILLLVGIGMWFSVKRLLQESRQRLDRAFLPTAESTTRNQMETVATKDYPASSPNVSESPE